MVPAASAVQQWRQAHCNNFQTMVWMSTQQLKQSVPKRIVFAAGKSEPMQPASAPDKVASVTMRLRIQSVKRAWEDYCKEQPEGWVEDMAAQSFDALFEATWAFINDAFINQRRKRSLRIEDLQGDLEVTVQTYVNTMRDWLWPELFPQMTTLSGGVSVGQWRSFWARLKTRVNATFSDGGQMRLGQHARDAHHEADASGGCASGGGDAGLTAGREAVRHRRAQTFKPGTREHASDVDLYLIQVSVEHDLECRLLTVTDSQRVLSPLSTGPAAGRRLESESSGSDRCSYGSMRRHVVATEHNGESPGRPTGRSQRISYDCTCTYEAFVDQHSSIKHGQWANAAGLLCCESDDDAGASYK